MMCQNPTQSKTNFPFFLINQFSDILFLNDTLTD
jgi:hypothetical protein